MISNHSRWVFRAAEITTGTTIANRRTTMTASPTSVDRIEPRRAAHAFVPADLGRQLARLARQPRRDPQQGARWAGSRQQELGGAAAVAELAQLVDRAPLRVLGPVAVADPLVL